MGGEQLLPAVIYGLAKYEVALNLEPRYLSGDAINVAKARNVISACQNKLADFFKELVSDEAVSLLEKLKADRPQVLATCRYDECHKLHRRSILQFKSAICQQDLDFKGFYTLHCTEKCKIDFHPWCWKHKKDRENKNLDKDYLHEWCATPDCEAPICKITVVKDNPDQPLEIIDKQTTDKMLSGGQKASDNAAGATAAITGSRSNENRDAKKEAPMLEPTGAPDDLQKELVDD